MISFFRNFYHKYNALFRKSTIAKLVAGKLGYIYVDTGAMYRAVALALLNAKIDVTDVDAVANEITGIEITICYEDHAQQVYLNGKNVSKKIRQEAVGNMASKVATKQAVRDKLLDLQRNLAATQDVVMDGRDIGTCVLPHADVKVYLTAPARVRAERRYKELVEKGESCDLDQIEAEIRERDHRDMTREHAPLRQAADAQLLDSSDMSIGQVVDAICKLIHKD